MTAEISHLPPLSNVTAKESSATAPDTAPYNDEEQQSLASHLSDKYRKAIETEHNTDLVTSRTQDVLRNASVLAAQQIVSLAMHAPNPNTRYKAATYIVDRVLGPVGKSENVGDRFAELLMNISTSGVQSGSE